MVVTLVHLMAEKWVDGMADLKAVWTVVVLVVLLDTW